MRNYREVEEIEKLKALRVCANRRNGSDSEHCKGEVCFCSLKLLCTVRKILPIHTLCASTSHL